MLYVWRDFKKWDLSRIGLYLNPDPPMGKILVQECYLNGCPHLAIFEIPDAVESDNFVKKNQRPRARFRGGCKKVQIRPNWPRKVREMK